MLIRLAAVLAVAMGVSPAFAQSTAPSVEFNLFSYQGAYLNKVFTFDEAYTEKYGIPVPVPFQVQIPIRDDIELIADGKPAGGIVKFTFATKDAAGRKFVENVHIIDATFPIPTGVENPVQARLQETGRALVQSGLPSALKGFADVKLIGTRETLINGIPAVELVATYTDPSTGPMALQMMGLPHPDRAESYFVLHNINRSLVPITGPDMLPETLGGRVLASFTYK